MENCKSGNCGASIAPPVAPGEVSMAMDELINKLHTLESLSEELNNKLTPVMRKEPCCEGDSEKRQMPQVPLAYTISDQTERIKMVCMLLEKTINEVSI